MRGRGDGSTPTLRLAHDGDVIDLAAEGNGRRWQIPSKGVLTIYFVSCRQPGLTRSDDHNRQQEGRRR